MSRRGRGLALLGLSAVLGGLAASDVAGREAALRRAVGPAEPVVVAKTALEPGQPIAAARLAIRRVPRRYVPAGAYGSPRLLEGIAPSVPIPAGADVLPPMLDEGGRPVVGPGERVVEVVAVGSADLIGPGTRADVLVTREDADGHGRTRVAVRDAEVLASRAVSERGDGGEARVAVSLRVSLDKAVELTAAQSFAREVRVLAR